MIVSLSKSLMINLADDSDDPKEGLDKEQNICKRHVQKDVFVFV